MQCITYKSRRDKRKKRFHSLATYFKFMDSSVDAWKFTGYIVEYCKRKARQTKKAHKENISKCKTKKCNCKHKYYWLRLTTKAAAKVGRYLINRIATEASYQVDYITLDPSTTDFFDVEVNPSFIKFRRFYAARRRTW